MSQRLISRITVQVVLHRFHFPDNRVNQDLGIRPLSKNTVSREVPRNS